MRRVWWTTAIVMTVAALAVGLTACGSSSSPPQPQAIIDKGTPYGDLLIPKLQTSVTDGAVGVAVESPITVSAEDGVLGPVTLATPRAGWSRAS